jgi:stage V sporulation protein SpoVS
VPSVQLAAPRWIRVPTGPRPWVVARAWRIVHVGQSAIILSAETDDTAARLMALTSQRRGLVAGGVCVSDDDDFGALARRLRVTTGSASHVGLDAWSAIPPAATTTVDLRIRGAAVHPEAVKLLSALLRGENEAVPTGAAMDPRPVRALAEPLSRAALARDDRRIAHLLSCLVGVGPGATPAGDDVIVGVLAGLDAAAGSLVDEAVARVTRDGIGARLRPLLARTTAIARHDLTAALAGEYAEHVQRTVGALADPRAVPAAVAAARGWGATSGIDLATGMAAGLAWLLGRSTRHRHSSDPEHRRSA